MCVGITQTSNFSPKSFNQLFIHSQTRAYLHSELAHTWIVSSRDESPKLCLQLPGTHPLYSEDEKVTHMSAIHQMPFPHKFSRIKQRRLRISAQRIPGSVLPQLHVMLRTYQSSNPPQFCWEGAQPEMRLFKELLVMQVNCTAQTYPRYCSNTAAKYQTRVIICTRMQWSS